jgi:nitrite reductase (NO-forming)
VPTTLDRPTTPPRRPRRYKHSEFSTAPQPRLAPPTDPRGKPNWLVRYRSHLLVGALSIVATAIALSPLILGATSRSNLSSAQTTTRTVAVTPDNLTTNVVVTASEFKFGPNSFNVPVGQKISFTLNNTGVVEHDLTVTNTGFSLSANPGQTATGDFTFDKPGVFDFYCSIPGHKDAGMKGTLTVVDPAVGAPVAAASSSVADMPGMNMGSASQPDIQPLPANLKPLPAPQIAAPIDRTEPAYVKLDLTTQKVTAQMADGVAYDYWTFDGTVPGPMLRVREGDTVEIDLHNAADAGVTHSIDLHAVTGPGGGAKVMQVAPGQDGAFRFEALNPGVYIYHCATPMVAQHIASGMYGMIVVEPKAGLPKVDHEYYMMQGDFYLQGQRGDTGLRAFDLNKMLDERPDYVLFNGGVGSLTGDNALQANVGDTIRIFFGDGGPNLTSSFHVIGAIFDRVFPEGSLTSTPETNVQTTHVSAGGATMVEFTAKVPGTYSIVDHSLGRMEKGAAGQIVVNGPANPEIFQPLASDSASKPSTE